MLFRSGQQAARTYTYEKDASGQPVMVGPEGQPLTKNDQGQYVDQAGQVVTAASPKISGFQQFTPYGTDRVAGLTGLQTGAFSAAERLGYDPTTQAAASGIEGLAQRAGMMSYQPTDYRAQSFAQPGTAASFMSP